MAMFKNNANFNFACSFLTAKVAGKRQALKM